LFPVLEGAGLSLQLPDNQHYIVSFALNWKDPGGAAVKARHPLVMVVADRAIRRGYVIDGVTGSGLEDLGTTAKSGSARIAFQIGRTFVVAGVALVKVGSKSVVIGPSGLKLTLTCVGPYACAGSAVLLTGPVAKGAASRAKGAEEVAEARFSIAAGVSGSALLHPTVAGKALLASVRAPRAMTLKIVGGGGPPVVTALTLKPA
jgi:hypothetical protein